MSQRTDYILADFDFALPPELIAQHPAAERSASRLLDGCGATPVDRIFRDLPSLLQPGDLLVFNDTRVIKARLHGEKPTGGAVEALVERMLPGHEVLAQLRASKSPQGPAG
jgi:S-adenosylmethionine:tRNA ribosyltransferase-isomerase